MAQRIVTSNKDDIMYAGFDLYCNVDVYEFLLGSVRSIGGKLSRILTDEIIQGLVDANKEALIDWMNDNLDDAEEIFTEEASLSKWSGNMTDNAVCGISGTLPEMRGNVLFMDLRVGVNTKEIQNTANWDAQPNRYFKSVGNGRYVNPVTYTYHGKSMKPGHDYSGYLNSGIARAAGIQVHPNWKGFVERAEERFWA